MKKRILTLSVFFLVSHLCLAATALAASEEEKAEILAPFGGMQAPLGPVDGNFSIEGMAKPEDIQAAFAACKDSRDFGCIGQQLEAKGFKAPKAPEGVEEIHAKAQACINGAAEDLDSCLKTNLPAMQPQLANANQKGDHASGTATSAQ